MAATREVARATRVLGDLLFSRNPDPPLARGAGRDKRIRWSRPLPLVGAKQLGRLAGATLNDVLMSAVAAALHRYRGRQRPASPVDLVTMVPVNVRPLDEPLPPELGNRFALVFPLPQGLSAPLARLAETKRRMDWLKRSPEAVITFASSTPSAT